MATNLVGICDCFVGICANQPKKSQMLRDKIPDSPQGSAAKPTNFLGMCDAFVGICDFFVGIC